MRPIRVAAAVVVAALLAACSSNTPQPAPQPSSTSVAPSGHGALAHCLSDHGVPAAPGPAATPPPGVDTGMWHQAMQACSSLAPGPAS